MDVRDMAVAALMEHLAHEACFSLFLCPTALPRPYPWQSPNPTLAQLGSRGSPFPSF